MIHRRWTTSIFLSALLFCQIAAAAETSSSARIGGLFEEEVISIGELKGKLDAQEKFILIDARNKKNFDEGHIMGAILSLTPEYYRQEELFRMGIVKNSPDSEAALVQAMQVYPKDQPIITYCNDHCQASAVLLLKLKRLGFRNVRAMEEGFQSWQKKGFPTDKSVS
jgi:rhodanese-related sulfurtransferase